MTDTFHKFVDSMAVLHDMFAEHDIKPPVIKLHFKTPRDFAQFARAWATSKTFVDMPFLYTYGSTPAMWEVRSDNPAKMKMFDIDVEFHLPVEEPRVRYIVQPAPWEDKE